MRNWSYNIVGKRNNRQGTALLKNKERLLRFNQPIIAIHVRHSMNSQPHRASSRFPLIFAKITKSAPNSVLLFPIIIQARHRYRLCRLNLSFSPPPPVLSHPRRRFASVALSRIRGLVEFFKSFLQSDGESSPLAFHFLPKQ